MKNKLLLPIWCRIAGIIILPFSSIITVAQYLLNYSFQLWVLPVMNKKSDPLLGYDNIFQKNFHTDLTGTIGIFLTLCSLFMIAFSREKHEDEYMSYVRLKALQISVYCNYLILAATTIIFYGFSFLTIMGINMFSILILYILIYYYHLYIRVKLPK